MSSDVDIADRMLDGPHGPLRVRVYAPSAPTGHGLVWAHGGGFAAGDLDMPEADAVGRAFAARGVAVMNVDYRLAPAFPYPVAHDEVVFAYRWAVASDLIDGPWALGGASAGGNLAAGAALRLAHDAGPVPALAVLAYPTLQAVQAAPDATLRALLDADPPADHFGPAAVRDMYENYLGGGIDGAEVYAIPGTATSAQLTGFPPTIIIDGEVDELRVSGEAFAHALKDAGVEVDSSTEPGTTHGHLNRPEESASAASIDRFAARILSLPSDSNQGHD